MGALVWLALLPLSLGIALAFDILKRRLAALPAVMMVGVWLWLECGGLFLAALLFLVRPLLDEARWLDVHYRLQARWCQSLLGAAGRLYGLTLDVANTEALTPRCGVLLVRHTSLLDTLLPVLIARAAGSRPRYVLKEELLWDPCLDVVGQRLPNVFISRRVARRQEDVSAIAELATNLPLGDVLVLFPEGTRFSPERRARRIQALQDRGDTELAARATTLEHTLLPRPAGTAAATDRLDGRDVVILAHTGFEGAQTPGAIAAGALRARQIRAALWRAPAAPASEEPEATARWLLDLWQAVDAWIGQRRQASK